MPYYLSFLSLPIPWAPVAHDLGGLMVVIQDRHIERQSAETELQRLAEEDASRPNQSITHPSIFFNRLRIIVEAPHRREALREAETEAYLRLGLSRPAKFRYFALGMSSVDLSEWEVLEKHVEIVAGPFATTKALARGFEAARVNERQADHRLANWREVTEGWPDAFATGWRLAYVRAADEDQAAHGLGIRI